jgi:hypothetical protein
LQAALQQSRQRFDAAAGGTDAVTLEKQPVCGVWTSRDVAGHVADWNGEFAAAAEHALGGPAPEGHPIEDGELYNTNMAGARASQSWSQAKADLDASFDRLAAILERIDDDQIATPAMAPWDEESTVGALLADASGHADEHVADLEAKLPVKAA